MKKNRALLAQLVAATVVSSALGVSAHAATSTPFGTETLSQGYMVVAQADAAKPAEKPAEGKCGAKAKEGKCGEGKCGTKAKEGKCGEGKCGTKAKEGKCGAKPATTDAPKPAY
jgi:uncharacterized low-complexity protein